MNIPPLKAVPHPEKLLDSPPTAASIKTLPPCIDRPVHVLTSDKAARRPSKDVICHTWSSPIPEGAILDTGQGFYVSSPEFCFAQMASIYSLAELIFFGFELCGSYCVVGEDLHQVAPLSTVARLKSFVAKLGSFDGKAKVDRALKYVIGGSASPMESILTIFLSLPYRMSGYGLPAPTLNHRINAGSHGHNSFYVCDLYWPKYHVAAEYDSNKFHTGPDRIARDSARRNALQHKNIPVISITTKQIMNSEGMDEVARVLAKFMGKRLRCFEPHFASARIELRHTLLRSISV